MSIACLPRSISQAQSYATFMGDNSYYNLVSFYDNEIARRRGHKNELNEESNAKSTISPIPNIQFVQQILGVNGGRGISDRWLFDTGADVDATNKRHNFKPGSEVGLRPSQFPIRTGKGIIYAESIGEIWVPITGPGGKETVMRLKHVVYFKTFPLNVMSGERFYRRGGRLKYDTIISLNGGVLTYINVERRGSSLWVFNQP